MSLHEIVLPITEPETEWVRGRALQKVSPTYSHARLQLLVGQAFADWADAGDHGRVGSGWRFRVAPPGEVVRPLAPDLAFLSFAALPADAPRDAVEVPLGTPTVAVEIVSPEDRRDDLDDKIATYLAAGTALVIVVDPKRQTIVLYDAGPPRALVAGDVLTHDALPGFRLDVGELFARAAR